MIKNCYNDEKEFIILIMECRKLQTKLLKLEKTVVSWLQTVSFFSSSKRFFIFGGFGTKLHINCFFTKDVYFLT